VLVGNSANDDPEGPRVVDSIYRFREERIIVILADDPVLVNALQRTATVVLQKSIREGFGLTVTEAMWKGACVVGGNAGGIRHQIEDGRNGFLVDNIDQAATRIVQIVRGGIGFRREIGQAAHQTVRDRFLMCRLAEDWLDLIGSLRMSGRLAGGA
jgi:trehalose synthase